MIDTILNHYGFSRLPFGKNISADEIYPTESMNEAGAMIELGLESEDIILITGPIGCGKSLAVRRVAGQLDTNRYQLIYLRGSIASAAELYKMVLLGMKIDPPHSIGKAKPAFFAAASEAARKSVVILDDAQDASPDALLALKAMTNFESDSRTRITFILAGQPELLTTLGYAHFDSLRARIRLSNHMSGMSLSETCEYIDHGLQVVKRQEKLFSDNAKMEIFKRTNGIARHINSLCYKAIVQGAIDKRSIIDTADLPQDVI
ncbi:MAG: AAA family ATPase [Spirochaetia bacterium]|nr:AAA family ATPase [Spirochaetia bacterium]